MKPRDLAHDLLALAHAIAPKDKRDWCRAMAAEGEELSVGRPHWAFEALLMALRWRLAVELPYAVLLLFGVRIIMMADFPVTVWLDAHHPGLVHQMGPLMSLMEPALLAFAVGLGWPDRTRVTAVALALIPILEIQVESHLRWATPIAQWWFDPKSTLYMAPPFIGLCASIGVCWLGASLGAQLRQRRAGSAAAAA
jgi:hypothetical protein